MRPLGVVAWLADSGLCRATLLVVDSVSIAHSSPGKHICLGEYATVGRRFPVEIRNQCIEAIMFIVMKQTLVSITIWCQIKIKIRKLRATKEIKCGI